MLQHIVIVGVLTPGSVNSFISVIYYVPIDCVSSWLLVIFSCLEACVVIFLLDAEHCEFHIVNI